MKDLTKAEIKKLINCGNVIVIYDNLMDYTFTFYYTYAGNCQEAVFLNKRFYGYFDLDEYVNKIKTRKDEKKYLTKLLKEEMKDNYYNIIEELNFIDSNILKDIKGEQNDNR